MGVPCMLSFSLFLLIFSVLYFFQFDYYVSRCVPPWVYPSWDNYCKLLIDYFLFRVREFFSYYHFKYSFRSFLSLFSLCPFLSPIMCVHIILCQRSLRLPSFLFIHFSVFCSAAVISTILSSRSFIHSSTSLTLLWIPSSVLFICLFVL